MRAPGLLSPAEAEKCRTHSDLDAAVPHSGPYFLPASQGGSANRLVSSALLEARTEI